MKTNTIKLLALFALLFAITLSSCSDNEDNDNNAPEENLSEIVMQDFASTINDIQIPSSLSQSSDPYGSQVGFQVQLFKSLTAGFASLLVSNLVKTMHFSAFRFSF